MTPVGIRSGGLSLFRSCASTASQLLLVSDWVPEYHSDARYLREL